MQRARRVILIGVESSYGHEVLRGVDSYCREHGSWDYHLGRDNSPEMVKQAKVAVSQWKADGIIACIQSDRVERFILKSGLPAVNVTGTTERAVPTIICDNLQVGRLGARHFLDSGFRNFAFAWLTNELSVQARCRGFCEQLERAGHRCEVFAWEYTGEQDLDWVRNRRRLNRWLSSLKKPLAMMCAYDPFVPTVVFACRHVGLHIPEDVAILGAGNEEFYCLFSTPRLSSVDLNAQRIGYEAAHLLDRMMCGAKAPAKTMFVQPGRVIARQSTDMIPIDDPDVASTVRYIREHAHEPTSVKDLLRVVPISRKTMERRFAKLLGRTPVEEIMRVHLDRALALLEQTDLPIPAVAKQAGFTGREIFAAVMRRRVGMAPTEYRKKSRAARMRAGAAGLNR